MAQLGLSLVKSVRHPRPLANPKPLLYFLKANSIHLDQPVHSQITDDERQDLTINQKEIKTPTDCFKDQSSRSLLMDTHPDTAIIFDCEFLTAEGSSQRFWCGRYDPDPVVAQIGLVKIGMYETFPILDQRRIYVIPKVRHHNTVKLDPFFSRLTGITNEHMQDTAIPLAQALEQTKSFADGAKLWSWGKDEFNLIAISCYVQGIALSIPVSQFGNACDLLLKAGMPYDDLKKTRSTTLAAYFGLEYPELHSHDALDDALSVAYVLQHLLLTGALDADMLQ